MGKGAHVPMIPRPMLIEIRPIPIAGICLLNLVAEGWLERGAHAATPFWVSFCGGVTYYLMDPSLPFPPAWVVWVLYGLAGQYLNLEGGVFTQPTTHSFQ